MPVPEMLRAELVRLGSVLVAYSGGVDSTYLAWAAYEVLGPENVLAVLADSASLPRAELDEALRLAQFPVEVVRTDEFERDEYLRNAPDRCFHCKEALFDALFPLAEARGLAHVALGTVTDDLGDVRPGLESARRRGAVQPLVAAGLSKRDVRELARESGLKAWDKPQAACLSSRIPHGTRVTRETLARVEKAESAVRELGFRQVRVRHLGDGARVEVGAGELARAQEISAKVLEAVRAVGYGEAVLDPYGYRPGGRPLPVWEGRGAPGRSAEQFGNG